MENKAEIDEMVAWLDDSGANLQVAVSGDEDKLKMRLSFLRQGVQTGKFQLG